ncbi:hypothetical protein NK553_17530 [Pseudomonas sp. ZM23]|uniref:Uncharacterized protein n=1 Tax=Pseudomonas triclosanedens TaxID=2961893 RepID=A0ABY7A6C3_9PSED|nr:hypothetical protein [Pseudomonas triclosanedens]MCP8465753.1 hypothetical protein [Pseudomonas triclosanedens]MCP8471248.1 hypothetical protein [Pseudomonas triclosanedens]MCP8477052.1 hypothetical protein [Pseudomonas triclosanedens]WAI51840.1 hypothetical protein OU419_11510 [Pseudomonas triclosanedens]
MKLSDSFDPRSLRPKRPGRWRWRFAAALAAVIAAFGILAAMAGVAALLHRQPAAGVMHIEPGAGGILLAIGLFALWLGVMFWRAARRRARGRDGLSLSPRLMKKRD